MKLHSYQGIHSNHAQTARFNVPTSYIAAITMSSCSCVGLAGAPSTLIHNFLTVGSCEASQPWVSSCPIRHVNRARISIEQAGSTGPGPSIGACRLEALEEGFPLPSHKATGPGEGAGSLHGVVNVD